MTVVAIYWGFLAVYWGFLAVYWGLLAVYWGFLAVYWEFLAVYWGFLYYLKLCRSVHACFIKTSRTTFKLEPSSKVWAH